MNREEAVEVLREVFHRCTIFDGAYVSLVPPDAADLLSTGYQVHIKAPIAEHEKMCMQEVLDRYGLAIKQEGDLCVIFRPK